MKTLIPIIAAGLLILANLTTAHAFSVSEGLNFQLPLWSETIVKQQRKEPENLNLPSQSNDPYGGIYPDDALKAYRPLPEDHSTCMAKENLVWEFGECREINWDLKKICEGNRNLVWGFGGCREKFNDFQAAKVLTDRIPRLNKWLENARLSREKRQRLIRKLNFMAKLR